MWSVVGVAAAADGPLGSSPDAWLVRLDGVFLVSQYKSACSLVDGGVF